MPLSSGSQVGPYEIINPLGSGGMGEVYRAKDTRLDRLVAVKVLPGSSSVPPEVIERFRREAKSASALNHPNICTIYDVGSEPPFIAMELLEGETLQQRLARGALAVPTIVDIGLGVTAALEAAHAKGIVHRDIKPSNVFLTPRGPKILDFGLAKTVAIAADEPELTAATELLLTEPGSTVGTMSYMSPEQVRALPLDARTDLFSFGVVLYEMATGVRPFGADSHGLIYDAILNREPAPPHEVNAAVPAALSDIIAKCLQKERHLRYQHASEIIADLQRLRAGQATEASRATVHAKRPSSRTVVSATAAILLAAAGGVYWYASRSPTTPKLTDTDTIVLGEFTNSTGDPVFDDALRQGLIVQLQQSPFLHVLSDQRVRRVLTMMGQPPDAKLTAIVAQEVCQRTGSAAIIEGSIASLGSQYVLGLRATDCRSGELLDSQQSQVPGKENVLGALSGMASAFRARAGESLATIRTHEKPLQEATTASLEALKAYSAGRIGGCAGMLPHLRRAVELDPEFALAHATLGPCYSGSGQRALAIQSVTRAYELRHRTTDPERFFIEYVYDRDVTGDLEKAFQTATVWAETYPRDLNAHGLRGGFSAHGTGRYEEVLQSAERGLAIDPDFVFSLSEPVPANMFLGRFDEAKRALQRAGDRLEPQAFVLGYYIALLEHDATAKERFLAKARQSFDPLLAQHAEALTDARAGQLQRARTLARQAVEGAKGRGQTETAANYESAVAVWETLTGNHSAAKQRAATALGLSSGRDVAYAGGFALALAGDTIRSESLANDLDRQFPRDTLVKSTYVPTLRALAAIARHEPARAIELLQANVPYERAVPATAFNFFFGSMYPVYVRAQAYAASGQHQRAVAELQKILDHPGLMMGDPAGARARLEKARSLVRAGDQAGARAAYQDFLELWKDADPDVPILVQAKAEYAKLAAR